MGFQQGGKRFGHILNYFHNYSTRETIISYRGSCFTSHYFAEFVQRNGVRHVLIAAGAPGKNGHFKRMNRLHARLLSEFTDEKRIDWDRVLYDVEFPINNSVNRSAGKTPSELLFGINQLGVVKDNLRKTLEFFNQDERNLKEMRLDAERKIEESQLKIK